MKAENDASGDPSRDVPESFPEKMLRLFFRAAPFLFVGSIVGVGSFLVLVGTRDDEEPGRTRETGLTEPAEPQAPARRVAYDAAELRREDRLKEALLAERGGRAAVNQLRSLRTSGFLARGGERDPVVLMHTTSGQAFLRVFADAGDRTIGLDRGIPWKTEPGEDGQPGTAEVSHEEEVLLKVFGQVHGPLLPRLMGGTAVIRSVETSGGESGAVIRVTFSCRENPRLEEVDLDPATLNVLRWHFKCGKGHTVVAHYRDHRTVNEISHPFSAEVWRSRKKIAELEVETLEPNFGAFDLLFRNPFAVQPVNR